jgi:outer membrane lipoprotein-sorting protein
MQRPLQVRFEIQFRGQTAVQVFDGAQGWKLRPFLNRRDVEPFTADELKAASMQPALDGPLVDYAQKGTRIELGNVEKVEGRDAYTLTLTMKNGDKTHVWIDAQTFLETKIEGQPRRLDGKLHPVEVYYRDYRQVGGLQVPFLLETRVLPIADSTAKSNEAPIATEKIVIEKVAVNPKLDPSLFSKQQLQTASIQQ